jgi:hypothetical protein
VKKNDRNVQIKMIAATTSEIMRTVIVFMGNLPAESSFPVETGSNVIRGIV